MAIEIINKNIRYLREQAGWTQKELAGRIDVKQPVIGSYEEFRSIPPIPMAIKIADVFKIDLDTLVRVDLGKGKKKSNTDKYKMAKDVLAITVNSLNKENVEFVNQKASAGYLAGYNDAEFVKELPKVGLPFLSRNKTHRAFEIVGDSMLPVPSKAIVIGEYIENLDEVVNGDCYVILTKEEGIVFKRVYNFLKETNKLLLVSDNPLYEPYVLDFNDIIEVWKKIKIIVDGIETNISFTGNQIASFVLAMQQQFNKI